MFYRFLVFFSLLLPAWQTAVAQLCTGSLGDPVVNITFGSGANPGAPLKAATTNLAYTNDPCAVNGFYTVLKSMVECNYGWHVLQSDHTGNPDGYFMLIDASFEPNDFYLDTVSGLCPNTTYEFGAWLLNLKKIPNGIRPDVKFTIETTTGQVLATYNSGEVPPESSPQWRQYGFFFTTTTNTSRVVLRMANRAPGGDGNDMALDDITFRPCGPKLTAYVTGSLNTTNVKICSNDTSSVSLEATVSAGYLVPAYQWQVSTDNGISWKDINGAILPTYTFKPVNAGTAMYRLSVAESTNIILSTCRVASNPVTVVVNKAPTITLTNDGPKCTGASVNLLAGGAQSYSWSGPNGFTANGASISVISSPTNTKYYLKASNSEGCTVTDSTTVVSLPKPQVSFSNTTPACVKTSINFTGQGAVASGSIASWLWLFGDGNTGNTQNALHVYTIGNSYTVQLVAVSDKGCTDTSVKILVVNQRPDVNFGLPQVCLNDAFAWFTDSSRIADGTESGFIYNWNFGDPGANAANPNQSALQNPQHSYRATGVYPVSLTVVSNNGCSATVVKSFTVNGAVPAADFALTASQCSNMPVLVTNQATVDFGSITRIEIFWDAGNSALPPGSYVQPATGAQYNHLYPVFGAPATNSVQVKMVAYSGISCMNSLTKTVVLKASPSARFNALTAVCESISPYILTAAVNTNGLGGTGVYSGKGITNGSNFSPQQAGAGRHNIQYLFTASNGCADSAQNSITVFPQPVVSAGPDKTLLQGGSVLLDARASGSQLIYNWSPALYLDKSRILNPRSSPPDDQVYTLSVTSPDNCTSTDEVLVTVLKTPVVPNAFSPNGDGINDTWNIRHLDSYNGVELMVFDRYGTMVYKTSGYNNPWNGTRNGKPLPAGTYYYLIDRKIAAPRLTGSVTIIR